ncbi:MAG: hypothetical protein M3Y87_21330, partial [Myxococcota bacterium]|nr:hypothetical protein [Myxococcota bacterium]
LHTRDGPLARVRPRVGRGAPSRSTVEWLDPAGMDAPESAYEGGATGAGARGEQGAIERMPIPQDYRDHVREYFSPGTSAAPE